MSFFNELKRRNVIRVALAYVVLSWVLLQVADIVIPAIALPDWSMKLVLVLLALGFPVALVFAWAFELTPEGLKLDRDVDRAQAVDSTTAKKLDIAVIILLVVAVGLTAYLQTRAPSAPVEVTATVDISERPALAQNSIAVLPFTNMSSDEENEFFADGLSEELLNVLAKIKGLKVAGRTSSFYFKGKNEDLRVIGNMLGVEHILEGSVRKSGNNVRITAQLVKAGDGFHLWSETYDRELNDIFAIQDEIASNVASALRVTLLGETESTASKANNIDPEVYARFIAAKARIASRTADNVFAAIDMLRGVTQEAPEFAQGWAALSLAAQLSWSNDGRLTSDESTAISLPAMEKALALAPEDDYVLAINGLSQTALYFIDLNPDTFQSAIDSLRKAVRINPENVEAAYWLAIGLITMEEFDEASALLDRALQLDPLAAVARGHRVNLYTLRGQFDEAIEFSRESVALLPDVWFMYGWAATAELRRGRPDRQLLWIRMGVESLGQDHVALAYNMAAASLTLGDEAGFREGLDRVRTFFRPTDPQVWPLTLQGDFTNAVKLYEEAVARDGALDWEFPLAVALVHNGDCDAAMQLGSFANLYNPSTEPEVNNTNDNSMTWVAYCHAQAGNDADAKRVLNKLLDYYSPKPGRYDRLSLRYRRMAMLAMLGERDRAIEEFRKYYDDGFGEIWNGPFPVFMDADPRFALLHDDPEFQEIYAAIRARNTKRLAALNSGELTVDSPL